MPSDKEGTSVARFPAGDSKKNRISAAVPNALADAWTAAVNLAGEDPALWRWGDVHQAVRAHPLAAHLDMSPLESVPMGGDADTIQAAGYSWHRSHPFTVKSLSVYRQVVELGTPVTASYIIPGGSSGDPRSSHFADQLTEWREHRRISMPCEWPDIDVSSA
jgi:penicillin amidase